ncbi:MAG: hypothetical protein R3F33_10875 [Planctomycetota bacterium]
MPRSLIGSIAAIAVMALASLQLQGVVRMGAWSGFLLGLGVSCLILSSQARALANKPAKVFEATLLGFLVKMLVLGAMAMAVRYWAPLAERMDWRAFLFASGAVMFLLALLGAIDTAKALRASAGASQGSPLHPASHTAGASSAERLATQAPVSEGRTSL